MQARRLRSVSNVDNTPESFLAFEGNESVHGVYDLLLNYRCVWTLFSRKGVTYGAHLNLLTNLLDVFLNHS